LNERYTQEASFVEAVQCPKCAKQGKDKGADNFGLYSDGHGYCFSCGFYDRGAGDARLDTKKTIYRPLYVGGETSEDRRRLQQKTTDAATWLKGYGITPFEIERYSIEIKEDSIVFPMLTEDGQTVTSTRYFNGSSRYITNGPRSSLRRPWGQKYTLVVVEDAVSGIRVARMAGSYPILGSSMPLGVLKTLVERFNGSGGTRIWLDPDKRLESLKIASRGSQWGRCTPVFSERDPKDHTDDEIEKLLEL
jgi:hypothetical protein